VRRQGKGDEGTKTVKEFIDMVREEVDSKALIK
jgi:hypothetical protein